MRNSYLWRKLLHLGQDIKHDAIILVRSKYRANRSASQKEWLEEFLDNYEILKLEIRLCVDLHLLSLGHQAELAPLLESVGCYSSEC